MLPLTQARVWDLDHDKAEEFVRHGRAASGIDIRAVSEVDDATRSSDVIVTATSSRTPYLMRNIVPAGAFVAAVGADSPDKSELAPELMAEATIVVDVLAQAATMGDLHHALTAGRATLADVHAELGDLVIGRKPGRTSAEEITVFDSTGTAISDAASAVAIYERAVAENVGSFIDFGAC